MKYNKNDQIKLIFERALELDKRDKELFFNNLSTEEKQYENEVKSLFNAIENNEDFLENRTE